MKFTLDHLRPLRSQNILRGVLLAYGLLAGSWLLVTHLVPGWIYADVVAQARLEFVFDLFLVLASALLLAWYGRHFLAKFQAHQDDFYHLIRNVGAATGETFFPTLVKNLAEATGADYAFVARFTDDTRNRVKTVAVYAHGQAADSFEFDLAGTPCQIALAQGRACFPHQVKTLFPLDHLAFELDVDHYTGIALTDCSGQLHGVMAVAGKGTMHDQRISQSLLELFALRAAAALEGMVSREAVDHMSLYDALTGLPNRRKFTEQLTPILRMARLKSEIKGVLFLDLDRFKNINDSLGHGVGDLLLKAVADRLSRTLRRDDLIARLGGDEFMILLQGLTQKQDAIRIAGKIQDSLRASFKIQGHELHVALSIGIALAPEHGDDVDALMKNADTAMNRAKELGRNNIQFYSAEMGASSITRLGLENDLRKALFRSELVLHYQPQYAMDSGSITGVEALLRWRHPERGLIAPSDFIPMAEENGQIVPIGKWVIREACEQFQKWRQEGLPSLQVAVNLSAKQFYQKDLPEVVARALTETGMAPECLELEITESILMQDLESTIDQLVQLMDLGVKISIDDFGTGYSSLSYLKRLPLHALKIDRSFVKDIGNAGDDTSIVTAVISLAHSLNLEVVAEGVETAGQMDFLRSQRCDRYQGFLMSPPVVADAIPALFGRDFTPGAALLDSVGPVAACCS